MKRKDLNEEFFKDEVWSHFQYIQKLLYTLTLDSVLTDDLAQETIIKCWRKIETIRTYGNVKSALGTIARNEFRQFHRRRKSGIEEPMDPDSLLGMMGTCNVEDFIRMEGDVHEFLLLFSDVKKEYVQVVLLADYYQFSLKDIAKLLHKNYNTVVSQHARGLEEMRKKRDMFEKITGREA